MTYSPCYKITSDSLGIFPEQKTWLSFSITLLASCLRHKLFFLKEKRKKNKEEEMKIPLMALQFSTKYYRVNRDRKWIFVEFYINIIICIGFHWFGWLEF